LRSSSISSRCSSDWSWWKISSPEVIQEIMSMASRTQSNSGLADARSTAPRGAAMGKPAILRPASVMVPSSASAPSPWRLTSALSMASISGVSIRGNPRISSIPLAFIVRTAPRTSILKISGRSVSSKEPNVPSVYNLKHLPGPSRPARPVLWIADDLEIGLARSDSMPRRARNCLTLALPPSTTYRTPGTVTDVSAILVANTIFLVNPPFTGWKAACWPSIDS
ncbi:hypothetical protein CI238_00666, partial [Colletotrichum incanum]